MLAAEVEIPQMFTAYAEDLGYLEATGLHYYQYFCKQCEQAFTSAWGIVKGSLQWCERGSYFYCPYCGTKHGKFVSYITRKERTPDKVRISVKTFKNIVTFEISGDVIWFRDLLHVVSSKYKEVFRFDTAKQTITFTRYENNQKIESMEIGNPFRLDIYKKSILNSFLPNSLANSMQKSELLRALKVFRQSVHKKLEKKAGHKLHSMHVSPGQRHGTFILPLFNIAYRVTFPNAPNLPVFYKESIQTIIDFWQAKMLSSYNYNFKEVYVTEQVISRARQGEDFVTAMIKVKKLPNKPIIKKILGRDPFDVGFLTEAFNLCENYDYALRLYYGFKLRVIKDSTSALLQFLKNMLPIYGEAGIVQLVEKENDLQDCIRLYGLLNDKNCRALYTEKVKLKDLHDWMAWRHRLQNHVNLEFNVPDYIIKRLSMQTDKLQFFLPKESVELLRAGEELHNCVASYGEAMKDNSKWVVLVSDDKGKLAACLEVQGKNLVQAKVDRNQPVAIDPKLNEEVITWAREAKLEINTDDLQLQSEKVSIAG